MGEATRPGADPVIELRDLRKVYRQGRREIAALAGLDLEVPCGGVYGFLGPNGAGKTTTVRALVGHLRVSSGLVRVLGADVPAGLSTVIDRVGALVEQPSFFPNFSARRNLRLLARSRGFPNRRVDEVLDQVGLADRADSRVAGYSLGMRQRLGMAAVLLKDPEVLIVDEPANGLDPAGIVEVRVLMRRLGAEGRTVFISSHILAEVQQTCDRVAIIARGRCVAAGTVAELLRGGRSRFRVRLPGAGDEQRQALAALRTGRLVAEVDGDAGLVVDVEPEEAHHVTRLLAAVGIYLAELTPVERTLEEAFVELTEPAGRDRM